MKMFIVAVIVAIGLSVGAYVALETVQKPAEVAFTTTGARVDPVEERGL